LHAAMNGTNYVSFWYKKKSRILEGHRVKVTRSCSKLTGSLTENWVSGQ